MIYHNNVISSIRSHIVSCNVQNREKKIIIEESLENIPDIRSKLNNKLNSNFDPNLPIDLISYYSYIVFDDNGLPSSYNNYTLYIVISTNELPTFIQEKVLFYKTYLSSIISTIDLKFVLVVNEVMSNNLDFFKWINENGIGLWYYNLDSDIKEKVEPLSLRELIRNDLIKERPEDYSQFFDKYIHNTVDSILGIKPDNIGKSYIDRKAIDEVCKIKQIKFKDDLFYLLNLHLTEKGNELEFAEKVFVTLWNKYIGCEYKQILSKFETSLQYIFSGYRDHYIHQLQVFLIGLPIIDQYYDKFKKVYKDPELCWLVASSFHDIAYPVQQYDKFGEKFFNEVFNIKRNPALCEFRLHFIDDDFLICMGYIINNLCSKLFHKKLNANWLDSERDFVHLFYKFITKDKNHGIMSSVSLLMLLRKDLKDHVNPNTMKSKRFTNSIFFDTIVPSSLSIAIHDRGVWSEVFGEIQDNQSDIRINKSINFNDDPLSFLLIYCDTIQEWARPSRSDEYLKEKKVFYLKDFNISKERVEVTLWTPTNQKNQVFFKNKQKELSLVQELLNQPNDIEFSIKLKDSRNSGEDFIMGGKAKAGI